HGLPPPVVDHGLGSLRARPVVAVERTGGKIAVKLRAVGGELLSQAVEHLDGQAARIGGRLWPERGRGAERRHRGGPSPALGGGRLPWQGGGRWGVASPPPVEWPMWTASRRSRCSKTAAASAA